MNANTGFQRTRCSYMSLLDSLIYGEKKVSYPKWIGFDKTIDIYKNLDYSITHIKYDDAININNYMDNLDNEKNIFDQELKNIHKKFYENDEITPLQGFFVDYPDNNNYFVEDSLTKLYLRKKYILDLIPLFGRYHKENESFSGLISVWNLEFSENYKRIKETIDNIKMSFDKMTEKNYANFSNEIGNDINKLNDLKKPLEIIYKNRKESSMKFDNKIIRLAYKIATVDFILLFSLSIFMPFMLIMLYFQNCVCLSRCLAFLTWNIMDCYSLYLFYQVLLFLYLEKFVRI